MRAEPSLFLEWEEVCLSLYDACLTNLPVQPHIAHQAQILSLNHRSPVTVLALTVRGQGHFFRVQTESHCRVIWYQVNRSLPSSCPVAAHSEFRKLQQLELERPEAKKHRDSGSDFKKLLSGLRVSFESFAEH